MDRYKFLRNKVSALINISKRKTYQIQIEESKENPRSIWKLFRKFGASCKKQLIENIIVVKVNDNFIPNEKKIADIFNAYFVNRTTSVISF